MLQRLGFPAVGPHRRFVTAIAIDAVGSGVFMPVSMLYFLAPTALSLVQVGAAISIAIAGRRCRPARCSARWSTGSAPSRCCRPATPLQAVGFAAYLFAALVRGR